MDHIFQFYTVLYSFSVLVEDPVLFTQTEKENVFSRTYSCVSDTCVFRGKSYFYFFINCEDTSVSVIGTFRNRSFISAVKFYKAEVYSFFKIRPTEDLVS